MTLPPRRVGPDAQPPGVTHLTAGPYWFGDRRRPRCSTCFGEGEIPERGDEPVHECPICEGTGWDGVA